MQRNFFKRRKPGQVVFKQESLDENINYVKAVMEDGKEVIIENENNQTLEMAACKNK